MKSPTRTLWLGVAPLLGVLGLCLAPLETASADPPAAPTNLVATPIVFGELSLTWEDNADDEEGYIVQILTEAPDTWFNILTTAPNATEQPLFGGAPASSSQFRVVAISGGEESASNVAPYTAFDAFLSSEWSHIRPDEPFSFTVVPNNASGATSITYSATGLPAGLTIDANSGVISGSTTEDGLFDAILEAAYDSPAAPSSRERFRLRIAPVPASPIVEAPLPSAEFIALGSPMSLPLEDYFEDPDTRVAVTIATSEGDMVFSLFDRALPIPVTNFLSYVDGDAYANNIFHRSVNAASFDIIQSGSFSGDANGVQSLSTAPAIVNAPGIPNDRGTLAYARTSFPDSATSGWYINTLDSPGLDVGDSYAVFGRISSLNLAVVDAIFAVPTETHSINVNGSSTSFTDFPTKDGNAPSIGPPTNLVSVSSITRSPALVFSITTNTAPAVVGATIIGEEIDVTPLTPGSATITVSATDIDGNSVSQDLTISVLESYASWATANGAPPIENATDSPSGGIFNYAQSYAFGGAPLSGADDSERSPSLTAVEVEGATYDALTFQHRLGAGDLSYEVQSSTDLGNWSPIWQSDEGFEAVRVVSSVIDGDFATLTVRAPSPQAGTTSLYFRVAITVSTPGTP